MSPKMQGGLGPPKAGLFARVLEYLRSLKGKA